MLLTITLKETPKGMQSARDIGFLLHKNPDNMHSLPMSFGKVYVFYPQATDNCCTAALLLDVDPLN